MWGGGRGGMVVSTVALGISARFMNTASGCISEGDEFLAATGGNTSFGGISSAYWHSSSDDK